MTPEGIYQPPVSWTCDAGAMCGGATCAGRTGLSIHEALQCTSVCPAAAAFHSLGWCNG